MPETSTIQEKASDKKKSVRFSLNWRIFNDMPFLHRTYGVEIIYNSQKTINYLVEVESISHQKKYFSYRIDRKRFFKDGTQLKSFKEILAQKAAACIYPLEIQVNPKGEIHKVLNLEEVKKRWQKIKEHLDKEFFGTPYKEYINRIETALQTPEDFLKTLYNDVFYDLVFTALYIPYGSTFETTVHKSFKWLPQYSKIQFLGTQKIKQFITPNNRIHINYKATGVNNGALDAHTQINYQLDGNNKSLLRLDGECVYQSDFGGEHISFKIIYLKEREKTQEKVTAYQKRIGIHESQQETDKKWFQFWK